MVFKDAYLINAEGVYDDYHDRMVLEPAVSLKSGKTTTAAGTMGGSGRTSSAVSGSRSSTNMISELASNLGNSVTVAENETPWPYNDVRNIIDKTLKPRLPSRNNFIQRPGCRLFEEEACVPLGGGDVVRPKCKVRPPTSLGLTDTSADTPRRPSNGLSRQRSPPEPVPKQTPFQFGKSTNALVNTQFTFEKSTLATGRRAQYSPVYEDCNNTLKSIKKNKKYSGTANHAGTAARRTTGGKRNTTHTRTSHPYMGEVTLTEGERRRRNQTELHRAQLARDRVSADMNDLVMRDADSPDPPSMFGLNTNPSTQNQSGPPAATAPNSTFGYGDLKSAGKRVRKNDDADYKPDNKTLDREERAKTSMGRRLDNPFAPPTYLGNNKPKSKVTEKTVVNTRNTKFSEDIYRLSQLRPPETKRYTRSELQSLRYTADLVQTCIETVKAKNTSDTAIFEAFQELRAKLHQMQFYDFIGEAILDKSHLFDGDNGLNLLIHNEEIDWPWDLQEDAQLLYNQMYMYGCDPHLLRGIKKTKRLYENKRKGTGYSFEKNYPRTCQPNVYGAGELINGQWWPLQICAMRDGAHGATEAGIYGEDQKGAYSIIIGAGGYEDIDNGTTLQYCGTSSDKKHAATGESLPSEGTKRLLESCDRIHNEIRVIRSCPQGKRHSIFTPSCGLRYDGVYTITGKELLHADTSMYRFTLDRCPGQMPIRFNNVWQRPTHEEKVKFAEIKL
ncbi:MAG: hypothetical protein Q9166_002401 [cf. Caloplaca sp. 2 TL-2023]